MQENNQALLSLNISNLYASVDYGRMQSSNQEDPRSIQKKVTSRQTVELAQLRNSI